jgi:hypothetical protein
MVIPWDDMPVEYPTIATVRISARPFPQLSSNNPHGIPLIG